jgi:hypothetical protein
VEGIVTGTAFLSSTILLAKAIVIHQLALRASSMFVGYHVATAYYVESPSGTSSPTWRYTSGSPLWP